MKRLGFHQIISRPFKAVVHVAAAAVLLFLCSSAAHGQGYVIFNNRVLGTVVAPVYGVEPGLEDVQLRGNATTNGGSVVYHAPGLLGTGYTAQLFYSLEATTNENALTPLTPESTFRTTSVRGFLFVTPATEFVEVPGLTYQNHVPVVFQMRAWDNLNGTVTSWDQAVTNPAAARGSSALFVVPVAPLPHPPSMLTTLTSFNLTRPGNTGGFVIDQQPRHAVVVAGATTNFSVHLVSSNPSNTFQWRYNGSAIAGATSDSLVLSNVLYTDAGNYDVVVTAPLSGGGMQTSTSSVARLMVIPNLLNIEYALVEPFGISAVRLTYQSTPNTPVFLEARTSPPGLVWEVIDSASSSTVSNYFYDVFATNKVRLYRLRQD